MTSFLWNWEEPTICLRLGGANHELLKCIYCPFPSLCVCVLPFHPFCPFFYWNICLFPNHLRELFKDTTLCYIWKQICLYFITCILWSFWHTNFKTLIRTSFPYVCYLVIYLERVSPTPKSQVYVCFSTSCIFLFFYI